MGLTLSIWMLGCSGQARWPGVSHQMWPGDIVTLARDLMVSWHSLLTISIGEIYLSGVDIANRPSEDEAVLKAASRK